MPRSRRRPGRRPYRPPADVPEVLAAKRRRDEVNASRKHGGALGVGGMWPGDLSLSMRDADRPDAETAPPALLRRKERRYGLAAGWLAYDADGRLVRVDPPGDRQVAG
jgi:hypothetical protein